MLAPSAHGIAIASIAVQGSKAGGVSIEGIDVDIGEIFVRNNGVQLSDQDNVAVQPTGQRVRIGSVITVDDQHPATIAYGLGIHSSASDVDIQSFLPIGSFFVSQLMNEGTNVRIVDYQAVVKVFLTAIRHPRC